MTLDAIDPTKFAHWIKGYSKFYEPIVRAWFEENGYAGPQPGLARRDEIENALRKLSSRAVAPKLDGNARASHMNQLKDKLGTKSPRLQFYMKAEKNGLVTGEFKSWGGYSDLPSWKAVKSEIVGQKNGLFLCVQELQSRPVIESVLVLPSRSPEHLTIEAELSGLYGIPVRLFYLDDIFRTLGPKGSGLRDKHLEVLAEAVEKVRRLVGA
jgi:hypothetical protein